MEACKLYKHQKELVDKAPDRWLLAHEVGTGKSITALSLIKKKQAKTVLTICPKSIVKQWEDYYRTWNINGLILSKETFRRDHAKLPDYEAILIDEAHYFAGHKSQLHKSALAYIKKHKPGYIYLLTGTPYMSSVWNLYALGKILGKDWKWHEWNQYFFDQVKMGPRFIPVQKKKIKEVPIEKVAADIVAKMGNTVKMEDCVDLPEQIYQTEYFELTGEQKKAMTKLEDVLPITRFTHEHQICGGTLKSDDYTEHQYFKSEKFDRLMELIVEHQLIAVVCRYTNEIDYIAREVKKKYQDRPIYYMTGERKDAEVIKQADKGVVLIQAAVSAGWEAPKIPLMVYYSYDFSLVNYIQSQGRIRRINNPKSNVYLSLVVRDSIDEEIFKNITVKKCDFHAEIYAKSKTL